MLDEIKEEKQIDVVRIGKQEVGPGLNLFLQCKSPKDVEELMKEDLVLCNLMIKKRNLQKKRKIKGRQCHKCGKLGHIMAHCTSEKICWTRGEVGHNAKDCKMAKKCILCKSTEHGALYGGCPAKANRELVKISQDEKKKVKLPIGMRGKETETTTLLPPSNPAEMTKTQKKIKKRNEKKKLAKSQLQVQPSKQTEKKEP